MRTTRKGGIPPLGDTSEAKKKWILSAARQRQTLSFDEVAAKYGRSAAQYALHELVSSGRLLRSSHGQYQAVAEVTRSLGAFHDSTYAQKLRLQHPQKVEIAEHIAKHHIPPESTLALDAGTCCTAVLEALIARGIPVDLFTSNLHAVLLLAAAPIIGAVKLKGGIVSQQYAAVCGEVMTEEAAVPIERAIIGVSGISIETVTGGGPIVELSTHDTTQHPWKRFLCSNAANVIIPAPSERLNHKRGTTFFAISRKTIRPSHQRIVLVTDRGVGTAVPARIRDQIQEAGVEIEVVPDLK